MMTRGGCRRERAPSHPQKGGLGSQWGCGEGPAALTFSIFVVSKNLTLNEELRVFIVACR